MVVRSVATGEVIEIPRRDGPRPQLCTVCRAPASYAEQVCSMQSHITRTAAVIRHQSISYVFYCAAHTGVSPG